MLTSIVYPIDYVALLFLSGILSLGLPIGIEIGILRCRCKLSKLQRNKILVVSLLLIALQIVVYLVVYNWLILMMLPPYNVSYLNFLPNFIFANVVGCIIGLIFGIFLALSYTKDKQISE